MGNGYKSAAVTHIKGAFFVNDNLPRRGDGRKGRAFLSKKPPPTILLVISGLKMSAQDAFRARGSVHRDCVLARERARVNSA